jgi:hypothetical protein
MLPEVSDEEQMRLVELDRLTTLAPPGRSRFLPQCHD